MLRLFIAIQTLPEDPLYEISINHENEDVPVDVGFCEGNDHLQIGIGGHRFGLTPHSDPSNGIFARFELWAPEDQILRIFDHCLGRDTDRNETLVLATIVGRDERGWTDAVLEALRTEPEFLAQMKGILLRQIRLFRESEIVARQTARYQKERTGTTASA